MRRFLFLMLALIAVGQTGCCGRWRAFFYRVFTCDCCGPHYGFGGGPAAYPAPSYAAPVAPPCATCAGPVGVAPAMPVVYHAPAAAPVFGPSTPLPAPSVNVAPPTPYPAPMGEKK